MKCNWKHPVFEQVYERADGCSEISGLPVYPVTNMNFAHILPKGKFPELCYDPENVLFVTANEHTLLDHGTHDQRMRYATMMAGYKVTVNWNKFYDKKDELGQKVRGTI